MTEGGVARNDGRVVYAMSLSFRHCEEAQPTKQSPPFSVIARRRRRRSNPLPFPSLRGGAADEAIPSLFRHCEEAQPTKQSPPFSVIARRRSRRSNPLLVPSLRGGAAAAAISWVVG